MPHYSTQHHSTLHCTNYTTPQLQLQLQYANYTDGLEVRMSCFPPKFFLWKLEWRTQMDVEILLKFYLSVRIMLVNVDKNVQKLFDQTCLPVVPGSPNLYRFVGLECLRSICLQNLWILYRFEIYVYNIYIYNPFLLLLNVPQILKTSKNKHPSPISEKFRLANLIFNWSPLENNFKIKLPFVDFAP